jgi:hypothetical protein
MIPYVGAACAKARYDRFRQKSGVDRVGSGGTEEADLKGMRMNGTGVDAHHHSAGEWGGRL